MAKVLSEAQIASYRRDGYLFPFEAFGGDVAEAYVARVRALEDEIGAPANTLLRVKAHLVEPWLMEIARLPAILDVVEDLIGPDIMLYLSALWAKDARDTRFVSWHQDSTYFGLMPHEEVTVWVALTPSTRSSGCVRVLPGSHHWPDQRHVETRDPDNMLSRGQAIAGIDESDAVDMELRPGQFSVHHERMVHGSAANASDLPRIGVSFMMIPTRVRSTIGRRGAILVRGEDRYGNWDTDPEPRFSRDPVSMAALERFQALYRDPALRTEAERAGAAG